MTVANAYTLLGLVEGASEQEIQKAYRLYATKLHPDKHNSDPFFDKLIKTNQ